MPISRPDAPRASALGSLRKARLWKEQLLWSVYSGPQVEREVVLKLCSSMRQYKKPGGQFNIP